MAVAEGADIKQEETETLLKDVVTLFSSKEDVNTIREAALSIEEIKIHTDLKHKEMLESVKELTSQMSRAKADHSERQTTLLDPTQKQQLLAERTRIDDNIRRLVLETDNLKSRISAAECKVTELTSQEQQARQQEAIDVKRARHTISLYANISSVR